MAISLIIGVPTNGCTFGYLFSLEPSRNCIPHIHYVPFMFNKKNK